MTDNEPTFDPEHPDDREQLYRELYDRDQQHWLFVLVVRELTDAQCQMILGRLAYWLEQERRAAGILPPHIKADPHGRLYQVDVSSPQDSPYDPRD